MDIISTIGIILFSIAVLRSCTILPPYLAHRYGVENIGPMAAV